MPSSKPPDPAHQQRPVGAAANSPNPACLFALPLWHFSKQPRAHPLG